MFKNFHNCLINVSSANTCPFAARACGRSIKAESEVYSKYVTCRNRDKEKLIRGLYKVRSRICQGPVHTKNSIEFSCTGKGHLIIRNHSIV